MQPTSHTRKIALGVVAGGTIGVATMPPAAAVPAEVAPVPPALGATAQAPLHLLPRAAGLSGDQRLSRSSASGSPDAARSGAQPADSVTVHVQPRLLWAVARRTTLDIANLCVAVRISL